MRTWALLLTLLLSHSALSSEQTVSWTPPTKNTDGSDLTDLAGYNLYWGSVSGGPYPNVINIPDASLQSFTTPDLPQGFKHFVITAYNASDVESDPSMEATGASTATPTPPTNLTVLATTVYSVVKKPNGFVLIAIGTVPPDTPCDSTQSVNGHSVVDIAAVTYTGTVRPPVVVAKCL
jgi:hypothetical protein